MKRFVSVLSVSILMFVFAANKGHAQAAPLYDVTYTPDPGSSSYSAEVSARAKTPNLRGQSSPTIAFATSARGPRTTTIIGSQSYNYVIPMLRMSGRHGMDLTLNLYYNSRVWSINPAGGTATFNIDRDYPSYGFRLDFGYLEYDLASDQYTVTQGDGTKHALPGPSYNSTDGTFIHYNNANGSLTYKDGTIVGFSAVPSQQGQVHPKLFRPYWIKDRNGNSVSVAYVTGHDQLIALMVDNLGRTVNFNYNGSNQLTSLTQAVQPSAIDPSGTHTYATFTWGQIYGSNYAWYNFSGLAVDGVPALSAPLNVLTGCTYANGTGYKFNYGDWGIINKIENLSSNGTTRSYISYNYPAANQGALTDAPAYTQETDSADGTNLNTSVWSFAATKLGTGVVTKMVVTDPNLNTSTTNVDQNTGLTSSVQAKDSAGTPLRTISYGWTTVGSANVPQTITTTLEDSGQQSKIQYAYDANGNVTDLYEYDFGLVLKRHTVMTYVNSTPYLNQHILNLPSQILVKDGGGTTMARTDLSYDDTALYDAGSPITGAPSHDDAAYGVGFTTRGNLTTAKRYSNAAAGTGLITRTIVYDSLGNMRTAQMDCCNQKVFNFSSGTGYSQPDSIVSGPSAGPQFTTSYTYSPDFSMMLSSTDENGQVTQYQYADPMLRMTSSILPPQSGTQVHVNTAYGDTVSPTITNSSTANSATSVTTLDGLGHVLQVDSDNGSTVVSRVTYAYDKLWQRTQVSNPFVPGDTVLNSTFTYDALGRVTQSNPPSSGHTQNSYSGNAVTVTDQAGKQKKYVTDALGHLTEVDEPGEASAGVKSNGTLTIGGTLRSQAGVGAMPGSGSISIGGQGEQIDPGTGISDTGWIFFNMNGVGAYGYQYQVTTQDNGLVNWCTVAAHLASYIVTSTAPVTASYSGPSGQNGCAVNPTIVNLTARTTGSGTNYSFSAWSTYDYNGTGLFTSPSFTATASGATLTGGSNGATVWDSGTVTVTIGPSFTASAPYSQSGNSTAAQVAMALIGTGSTGLNRAGSPVTATANGAAITLTYNTVGVVGNVTVTASSSTNDPTHFPGGSFSGSTSLTNGADPYSSGLAHPFVTTNTYDTLGNLTATSQAAGLVNGQPVSGQPRSHTYDSLGRVLTVTTPESGTVTNYYTTSGGAACANNPSLPCRIQDARGVVTTLSYDNINRPTGVTYSDGTPSASYVYDAGGAAAFALGRLTSATDGSNSTTLTYDNLGRNKTASNVIDGTTYLVQYGYNLASELTSITYPSGRVVQQNVDAIGRLLSISDSSTTYMSGLSYNAAGETVGLTLGNGVVGTFGYNDHLQTSSLHYSKGTTDILNLTYDYATGLPGNNGQIQVMHYFNAGVEDLTKSENFTYDPVGRLSAAHTTTVNSTAGTWSLQWAYDRLGNRTSQALVGGNVTIGQPNFTIDPATNHITSSGFTYDAAGNQTHDASNAYTYDGANRLTRINAGPPTYTYYGPLRIKKVAGTTTTVYVYSGSKPIAEYVNGSLGNEYIYAGSALLATINGANTTYHHPDHLSNRAETNGSGNLVRSFGHFPYGETWYETGTADKRKFTSYEHDSLTGETGLDYAMFREYASGQARFSAADPMGSMNAADPQSLNRYAYVENDPVNMVDPMGLKKEQICTLTSGDPGEAVFCFSFETGFLDDPFLRGGASFGSFPLNYTPGLGYTFAAQPGFSISIGGLPEFGSINPCLLPGGCPSIPFPSWGLIPGLPSDPCPGEFGCPTGATVVPAIAPALPCLLDPPCAALVLAATGTVAVLYLLVKYTPPFCTTGNCFNDTSGKQAKCFIVYESLRACEYACEDGTRHSTPRFGVCAAVKFKNWGL